MRNVLTVLVIVVALCAGVLAKLDLSLYVELENAPFVLGVASGEPSNTSVVIWTRAQSEDASASFTSDQLLVWRLWSPLAEHNGTILARAADDFTVAVVVDGLESNTRYSYSFTHAVSGNVSRIGQTRTLPSRIGPAPGTVKIVTVSCGSVWSGWMHSYNRIADLDDVSAVLHLGDYIYPELDRSACERVPFGLDQTCRNECRGKESSQLESVNVSYIVSQHNCSASELDRFRWVHRYYLYDPMMRRMRARHPLIAIFDNHDLGSPRTMNRTSSGAIRAFLDYVPGRSRLSSNDSNVFYRDFLFGPTVHILALDSRALGRSNDSALLFAAQKEWAGNALGNQTGITWRVVMTTTAFAPWAVNGWDVFMNGILGGVLAGFLVLALSCCGLFACFKRKRAKALEANDGIALDPGKEEEGVDKKRLVGLGMSSANQKRLLQCCICYGVFNILVVIVVWIAAAVVVSRVVASRGLAVTASNGGLALVAGQERNWDGNPDRRREFLSVFRDVNATKDNVWVSGDLHMSLASDVRDVDHRDASSFERAERFGVEMLSSSVSRSNVDEVLKAFVPSGFIPAAVDAAHTVMYRANPHFKYFETTEHGYGVLTFSAENVTGEFWYTRLTEPSGVQRLGRRFIALKGSNQWAPLN